GGGDRHGVDVVALEDLLIVFVGVGLAAGALFGPAQPPGVDVAEGKVVAMPHRGPTHTRDAGGSPARPPAVAGAKGAPPQAIVLRLVLRSSRCRENIGHGECGAGRLQKASSRGCGRSRTVA